jgi:hypothetical protein
MKIIIRKPYLDTTGLITLTEYFIIKNLLMDQTYAKADGTFLQAIHETIATTLLPAAPPLVDADY